MKSTRHINKIIKYLESMGRPCNTIEIYDYINTNTKHGRTVQGLGNILAKNPELFIKVGCDLRRAITSGKYNIAVWDLTDRVI